MTKAGDRQDMAAIARIGKQIQKIEEERAAILNSDGAVDNIAAAEAEARKDSTIVIGVDVNRDEYSFAGDATAVKIKGADAAYVFSGGGGQFSSVPGAL